MIVRYAIRVLCGVDAQYRHQMAIWWTGDTFGNFASVARYGLAGASRALLKAAIQHKSPVRIVKLRDKAVSP